MQNTLFNETKKNILPGFGEVYYYGPVLTSKEADKYFTLLRDQLHWEQEKIRIAGKTIQMERMVAWYGDHPYPYTYSGATKIALPFTEELISLKHLAEAACHENYNSCLLNLYPNGHSGMGWHSDNENSIVPNSSIASLSIGATRKFSFKQKSDKKSISLVLENGSLLEMRGTTQSYWLHSLPKSKRITEPRINLTFRRMIE
ncbi:MAG: alpha-ketoglutarate-dependent dioxygenase AlkB [Bacteroidia bacterium]|nr:alpha-ketoglutarate-dependent dioxygenase AlkB [Bacteroidia bacterium]